MSGWIHCKVRMPTEADHDASGRLFWRCQSGYTFCGCHDNARTDLVAWMQIPEFTPIPDPPEGYAILQDYDADPDIKALCWLERNQDWYLRPFRQDPYTRDHIYAVPIKPPEPQYRPFASKEEFRPFRDRWWRDKNCPNRTYPSASHTDELFGAHSWERAFERFEFEDGTPFGIPVNPEQ